MYELTLCVCLTIRHNKLNGIELNEKVQTQLTSLKNKYKDVTFAGLIKNLKIASVGDNSVVLTSAVTITDIPSGFHLDAARYQTLENNFRLIRGRNILEKALKSAEVTYFDFSEAVIKVN